MECKINIFLSYRQRPLDQQVRDELKRQCDQQGFNLVYDDKDVPIGRSLTAFMDDIGAARCVILLLSPEYFQSVNTLYELVRINEYSATGKDQRDESADLNKRLIFPQRLTKNMNESVIINAKNNFWLKDKAARDVLCQKLAESDPEAVWQRVLAAWSAIINPTLNDRSLSLEEAEAQGRLVDSICAVLVEFEGGINRAVEKSKKDLQEKIKKQLTAILEKQSFLRKTLAVEFNLYSNSLAGDIAQHIVAEEAVGNVLKKIPEISRQQKNRFTSHQELWEDYLYDTEQFCGWLLINSVDPQWWFQNQLKFRHSTQRMTNAFALVYPPYTEVIISRWFEQAASYDLDEYGGIKPMGSVRDTLLFDASSPEASGIQMLAPIYKDLLASNRLPPDVPSILSAIELAAKARSVERDGKHFYYIVPKEHLDILQKQTWFTDAERRLAGYFQFVCCDIDAQSYDDPPTHEQQDLLIEHVANILRLRKS